MAEQAALHGFTVTRPYGMGYIAEFGVYPYSVRSSLDIRGHGRDTSLWVDGNTGQLQDVDLPSGQHTGNTGSTWLWGLHYGDIRDWLPYRVLVCLFGFVLSMLSVTGVYIWWVSGSRARNPTSLQFAVRHRDEIFPVVPVVSSYVHASRVDGKQTLGR